MNKELIVFAIVSVIAVLTAFDFIVFTVKSAPKKAMFPVGFWWIGMISIMALVYWVMNGYHFT